MRTCLTPPRPFLPEPATEFESLTFCRDPDTLSTHISCPALTPCHPRTVCDHHVDGDTLPDEPVKAPVTRQGTDPGKASSSSDQYRPPIGRSPTGKENTNQDPHVNRDPVDLLNHQAKEEEADDLKIISWNMAGSTPDTFTLKIDCLEDVNKDWQVIMLQESLYDESKAVNDSRNTWYFGRNLPGCRNTAIIIAENKLKGKLVRHIPGTRWNMIFWDRYDSGNTQTGSVGSFSSIHQHTLQPGQ